MGKQDLVGERFAKLVVISFAKRDRYSHKIWECKCDCGNKIEVLEHNLKNKDIIKSTKSCGCLRRLIQENQDPIGKKFSKLTVVRFSHSKNKKSYYECICECGTIKYITMNALQSGDCLSCGCAQYSQERVEKSRQTCLKKYGVNNPSQNKDIRLKAAKSSNNSYILYHWKTNEELICQGSWERKVIEFLNKNQIDYQWQPQSFTMINNKTYTPDLFLINEGKWIEIKGYFYDDALEKWNWFHQNYPNSELWNEKKLKEMKIL